MFDMRAERSVRTWLGRLVLWVLAVVTNALSIFFISMESFTFTTWRLVVIRKSTGEEILRGDIPALDRRRMLVVVRRDLERLDEDGFLRVWGEPGRWEEVLTDRRWID